MDIFRNRRTPGFRAAARCRKCLADISVPRAVPRRANLRGRSGEPPTPGARLRKVPRSTWSSRRPQEARRRKPLRCVEERSSRPELLLLVLSGRELHTIGDARIRGKEQPAGSRASCRPLLRFVQLSSERTLEPVRQDSSFAEKQESHPALLVVVQLSSKDLGHADASHHANAIAAPEHRPRLLRLGGVVLDDGARYTTEQVVSRAVVWDRRCVTRRRGHGP